MQLYNSLTRQKEDFVPLNDKLVTMYVCGPTVYNYIHIGNARAFLFFDVVRRYLMSQGYTVTYVQNITDIDDKLLAAMAETGLTLEQLSDKYIEAFFTDMSTLGVSKADFHPRATKYISEMIALIERLVTADCAYVSGGDVYFRTGSWDEYGKLSQQSLSLLKSGVRVDINAKKEDQLDFVLWKAAKDGEESWESPWGRGRPGWHTECTAMILKLLGEQIDIHAGGIDLCFPHHENELAQSEVLSKKPFARYWLHNGFIEMDQEKMSKSLGNVCTVRDLCKRYSTTAIRYFLLSVHYRSPMQFTEQVMEQAENSVEKFKDLMNNLAECKQQAACGEADALVISQIAELESEFKAAMNDDLNTANAISVLFTGVKLAHELMGRSKTVTIESFALVEDFMMRYGHSVLGLIPPANKVELDLEIAALITSREQARKDRDFTRADQIRDQLLIQGIVLEDTACGVRWKKVDN